MPVLTSPPLWEVKQARVYTNPELKADDWTARDYLACDYLSRVCGPDIDEARLSIVVGRFTALHASLHDGEFAGPSTVIVGDLALQYVKIEVLNGDDEVQETWFGRIEADRRATHFSTTAPPVETGVQTFYAYGIAAELDRVIIRTAKITPDDELEETIGRGLGFNIVENGNANRTANRSENPVNTTDKYVFANYYDSFSTEPSTTLDVRTNQWWTAADAVAYLLEYYCPRKSDGEKLLEWDVIGDEDVLKWYPITVETERRSTKQVLDDLIDRRRLVMYRAYVELDEDTEELRGKLLIRSLAHEAIPIGATFFDITEIPANGDQITLTYAGAPLVGEPEILNSATATVHKVIAEGERIVSLFSVTYTNDDFGLNKGWSAEAETAYDAARYRDETRDVHCRFILPNSWMLEVHPPDNLDQFVRVMIDPADIPLGEVGMSIFHRDEETEGAALGTLCVSAARFLPWIPLQGEQQDEFRRPFALFLHDADEGIYLFSDKMNDHDDGEDPPREFGVSLDLLSDRLGVRLEVSATGGQGLIAGTDSNDVQAVNYETVGEGDDEQPGLILTAALEWDDRVSVEVEVSNAPGSAGAERVQVIPVRDAHLWFEIPGCVTDIDEEGALEISDGRVLRDDRDRLLSIATAAAGWYGVERKAIRLMHDVVIPEVDVGQLVTKITNGTDTITVNTVITGVATDFTTGRTSMETGFAEVDFTT